MGRLSLEHCGAPSCGEFVSMFHLPRGHGRVTPRPPGASQSMLRPFCGHHGDSLDSWPMVRSDLYIYPEGTLETRIPTAHMAVAAAEAGCPDGLSVLCP